MSEISLNTSCNENRIVAQLNGGRKVKNAEKPSRRATRQGTGTSVATRDELNNQENKKEAPRPAAAKAKSRRGTRRVVIRRKNVEIKEF